MKTLRSVLIAIGALGCLQIAHAQFSTFAVQTDGGNHSNVKCYVNVATTQYVSTSSTPVSSTPTLPGWVTAGANAEWTVSNSISGSTTQWTYGSGFTAAANWGDIKGKNNNGGSVPLFYYSFVAVSVTGTIRVSTAGSNIGLWEIYKNGGLYATAASGTISNYPVTVSNGDSVWIVIKPATDNTNNPILTVWNY